MGEARLLRSGWELDPYLYPYPYPYSYPLPLPLPLPLPARSLSPSHSHSHSHSHSNSHSHSHSHSRHTDDDSDAQNLNGNVAQLLPNPSCAGSSHSNLSQRQCVTLSWSQHRTNLIAVGLVSEACMCMTCACVCMCMCMCMACACAKAVSAPGQNEVDHVAIIPTAEGQGPHLQSFGHRLRRQRQW